MKTGYSVPTMKKRLEAIADEVLEMIEDGRMTEAQAHRVRAHILAAVNEA